jgi:integrase
LERRRLKLPKYTNHFVDHDGTARYYLRMPGRKRVALPGLPWSPEFMAAREAAMNADWVAPMIAAGRTRAGTVNAAIISYYQSSAFRDGLKPSSQKMRRAILERFRVDHGDKPIALLPKRALQILIDKKTPAAQANMRKADPFVGVTLTAIKTNGHHPWTLEECQRFEAFHPPGTRARLAYELLLQVGHARCDVVRMGRQHIRDGVLSMSRQKTGVAFFTTIRAPLQEAIDAMPATNHLTFLITAQGKQFTAAGFGNWFRDVCNQAELPKRCTSHGLRKAAATRAANLGATTTQLKAWFGWTSDSEAEVYTRTADRKRNAMMLGEIMAGTEIGKPANQFANPEAKPLISKGSKS